MISLATCTISLLSSLRPGERALAASSFSARPQLPTTLGTDELSHPKETLMPGRVIGYLAAAVCVGAGIYLLQYHAATTTNWFQVIGHGMGIYFIGKGLFVARATYLEAEQADRLKQLVEFGLRAQNERTRKPG